MAAFAVGACSGKHKITVSNPSVEDRGGEMVEIDFSKIEAVTNGERFRIVGFDGADVPYQVTYDGKLIFQVDVKGKSTSCYYIEKGEPSPIDSLVYGRFVPERKDDMAWENDRGAYRAYGLALQQSGEQAFGYDIWTKSVAHRVLDKRYYDDKVNHISFHEDHGDGMDVYSVGPTLGGGTAALLNDAGAIVYPYCYTDYEILENGPLRFTVKLRYGNLVVDCDSAVVETRVISLDRGSFLNRTVVSYDGLSAGKKVAPGIVVHKQNPDGYILDADSHYMSYADLTDNANAGNGVIFVGVVSPDSESFEYRELDEPCGDAVGHLLAPKSYTDGEDFTYYWGAGWSKGGMPDMDSWSAYLKHHVTMLETPLEISVE